jgi:photosystem II stability/assembly factor-like uncharacterized protein
MTRIFALMRGALLVYDGDAQTAERTLGGHDFECVAVSADAPDRVFCGTFDAGLVRSLDGGTTWNRVGEETLSKSVTSLAVSPYDSDVVYAGTEPSAVFRSRDGGETWTELDGVTALPSEPEWAFPPRPHTHHVRWVEPDPADADHLYVSIEAGALVQTHDAGQTWEDRRPSARRDNHSLTTHPDEPGRAWAAAGDGYAETSDGGQTWEHPQEGLDHRYCWSVVVDPGDPDRVLVSSADSARVAHNPDRAESYLYRREGDGAWERLDGRGVPTGEGVLRAVLATGPAGAAGVFYALTNRGLYRTEDGGDSWSAVDVEWPNAFERQTPRGLAVVPSP